MSAFRRDRVVPFTLGGSPVQLMKVMLVTSSFTLLSNPSRVQASWVNALNWWEVRLKLLFFMGSSIGTVRERKKKRLDVKEEGDKINSACLWMCDWERDRGGELHHSLQFSKATNSSMKIGFQPNLPTYMHSSENNPILKSCLARHLL